MLVMTYSQARQNFSSFLDSAKENGMAVVKRSDGSAFKVVPYETVKSADSPFKALAQYSSGVNSKLKNISIQEIVEMIREDREERADQIIAAATGKKAENFFGALK